MIVTARTFLIGGAGGVLFAMLGAPAAWLCGAMVAVATAALAGVAVGVPEWLRWPVLAMLGLSIGATLTPEMVARVVEWPASLAALAVAVAAITAAAYRFLRSRRDWDAESALFASVPGALSLMVTMAAAAGADVRRVALVQTLRLVILVAVLPPAIGAGLGGAPPEGFFIGVPAAGAADLALMLSTAAVGIAICRLGRLPMPELLGALLASGGLHAGGVVGGRLPDAVLMTGLVVVGCLIGSRFAATGWPTLRATAADGLAAFLIAFAVAALFAVVVSHVLELPVGAVMLAFAPGGIEAMTYLAIALHQDPAYVAAHHVARILALTLVMPAIARAVGAVKPPPGLSAAPPRQGKKV